MFRIIAWAISMSADQTTDTGEMDDAGLQNTMSAFMHRFLYGYAAALIRGISGIKFYTWGGDGILCISSMINPTGINISFRGFLICAAIAFIVSGVIAFFVTDPKEKIDA